MITIAEFKDVYDNSPIALDEFAEGALALPKTHPLHIAARTLLNATDAFETLLEEYEVTPG